MHRQFSDVAQSQMRNFNSDVFSMQCSGDLVPLRFCVLWGFGVIGGFVQKGVLVCVVTMFLDCSSVYSTHSRLILGFILSSCCACL